MAVINYKTYKISLDPDSNKTQGLRTGDIVRRQYYDGKNIIYSLMCVLDKGETEVEVQSPVINEDGSFALDSNGQIQTQPENKTQHWFIGALLEGDEPLQGELLDFVRVTSLFDTNRSGALYLTASDEEAPFMDVIDGIGRNCSLSWPENISGSDPASIDPKSQYCITGAVTQTYNDYSDDRSRICTLTKGTSSLLLKQSFYEYIDGFDSVKNFSAFDQLIISYWVKTTNSNKPKATITLGYADGSRTDGTLQTELTDEWQYKFHVISVENSGRHLRSLTVDFDSLSNGDEIQIADFNIILLSSLSNFGDASQIRVGRLSGVADPVFGRLDGYGAYLQKLFASNSAHISGTLTAGDENGFASTFYAGKIHKNVIINSLGIDVTDGRQPLDLSQSDILSPTGVGNVYDIGTGLSFKAQTSDWVQGNMDSQSKVGQTYCLSFWTYATDECQLSIYQDTTLKGTVNIRQSEALSWQRQHIVLKLSEMAGDGLIFNISPIFQSSSSDTVYFSAPQLEKGSIATQYQPTDSVLSFCNDYGAWFNRGGIGGTIQNPLLRLETDGSIRSNNNSFLIEHDGSGHIAGGHIVWNKEGDMHFKDVSLFWDELDDASKKDLSAKSCKIVGPDTFTLIGDETTNEFSYLPSEIILRLEEHNIDSTKATRQWYYVVEDEDITIENQSGKTLTITPQDQIWETTGSTLIIKCVVTSDSRTISDVITLRKNLVSGYTVEITSDKGTVFKNGFCETVLRADVYFQGKLVDPDFISDNYILKWEKYNYPDLENEITNWWNAIYDEDGNLMRDEIDVNGQEIHLSEPISGQEIYVCKLINTGGFPYKFPIFL